MSSVDTTSVDTDATGVTPELIQRVNETRTCGFLGNLREHIASVQPLPNGGHRKCVVCGERVHEYCSLCDAAVHCAKKKIPGCPNELCFFIYHDTGCIGIPKKDWKVNNNHREDWQLVSSPDMLQAHCNSVLRVAASASMDAPVNNSNSNSNGGNTSDNGNTSDSVNATTPTGNGSNPQHRRIGNTNEENAVTMAEDGATS